MRARHYAQAIKSLLDAAKTDAEKDYILMQSAKVLVANGHHSLAPKILRLLAKLNMRQKREHSIAITSAKMMDHASMKKLFSEPPYSALVSSSQQYIEHTVNPALIGGVVVRAGGMRVDASKKRALLDLYHFLTQ
jgi:F0F1-type ATP synthase delta subunit